MGSLNLVHLIGYLGKDLELRHTSGGVAVATVSLATTERWKNRQDEPQERTEWHRVVLWGRLAESLERYLTKGAQIYVQGSLQTRDWEDKRGAKRQTTEIRAHRIVLLGSGARDDERRESSSIDGPVAELVAEPATALSDDDIPF